MNTTYTRRECLAALASVAVFPYLRPQAASGKAMRGAFMILSTPYTSSGSVDYDDLAGEVSFVERCGVQGMVWPQNSSELPYLTKEERMRGMEVLADAARGREPALVLGVQADDTRAMLEYARRAEQLEPDAMIAMPPKAAGSLDEYRQYFRALCRTTSRPVFIQTSGGTRGLEPTVDFILELASELPNFGYVKEEHQPVIQRMKVLAGHRPDPIKSVFGANFGLGWPYEMRLGLDGTMTGGAMYADIYALLWSLYLRGDWDDIREVFSKLLLMLNLDRTIPGIRLYVLKKRGVFKTTVSRRGDYSYPPEAVAEIEHNFAALRPYLKV